MSRKVFMQDSASAASHPSRCPHKADRKPGHRYCPSCHREYMREWLLRKRELLLAALPNCANCGQPRTSLHNEFCGPCRKARQAARSSTRAYANVYQKRGVLTPQPCRACGTTEGVEKHHHDYRKPLEVEWLCRACHRAHHQAEQIASRETIPQERA